MAESMDESQEEEQEAARTISSSQSCVYIPKEDGVLSGYAQNTGTFELLPEETKEDCHRRHLAYTNTWTHIKQCMDELLSQQHDTLLGQVVQFVETAKKQWVDVAKSDHHQPAAGVILLPYLTMIPTAAIIAGVSFSDHEVLYQHLATRLETEVTPHIVTLRSHDCSLGMSAIVKEIHTQLIDGWVPDREKGSQQGSSQQKRLPRLTISTLLSWHLKKLEAKGLSNDDSETSQPGNSCASSQAKSEPVNHRLVVFVLEDFDMFSPQVLEDLVVSLKPHLASLPLVLILGLATSISLHSLTQSTLSDLFIEHFRVQPATTTLNAAVNKILINSTLRFRLKEKALNYILHHFLYLNFSIVEFQKGLQFAAIEHFSWQPLSFLCDTSHSVTDMVNSMSHIQFEMTRSAPSFQKYVESLCDPVKQLDLLKDDLKLQPTIISFLTDIIDHHESSPVLLHCLHILTRDLPGVPLGNQIYDLYYQCLLKDITEGDDFESAWKFIRVMTRQKLEECVTDCVELLKIYTCPQLSEITKTLESFLQELSQLSDGGGKMISKDSKTTRKKKQATDFEKIRTKILDYILRAMRKHLRCISTFPLHEIFYFNQASWMKRHLNPVISNVIHKALSNPNLYIPTAGSVSEQSSIDPNMPDVCIVYQLYLECGKLINTEDWRKAFLSIVSPDTEGDNEDILHERFHSAVSQLQFMGFVRPAKRKKDHMQRLTWYHYS